MAYSRPFTKDILLLPHNLLYELGNRSDISWEEADYHLT